jgi:hypothetical protein
MLEDFVKIDLASSTAGVPEVPGEKDRYWETFTSRALDRVEEDAATRVHLPEKRSRPLFPLELPKLVPAMSIALVIVVSAGVLIKVGRVAPVPEKAIYGEAGQGIGDKVKAQLPGPVEMDKQIAVKEQAEARSMVREEQAGAIDELAGPLPEVERARLPEAGEAAAPDTTRAPTPVAPLPQKTPALEANAGKLVPSSVPPSDGMSTSTSLKVDEAGEKKDLFAKAPALADDIREAPAPAPEPEPKPEPKPEPVPSAPVQQEVVAAVEPVTETLPLTAPTAEPVPGKGVEEGVTAEVTGEEIVSDRDVTLETIAPVAKAIEESAATLEPIPPEPEVPPSPAPVLKASAPPAPAPKTTIAAARPSQYRGPSEQLEHARRLSSLRMYWESEQILKDLISQEPPSPVFEEASILMVDVLSNQNRNREAQQVLDDAKVQFPSSDLIQQYRLEAEPSVETGQ